MDQYIGKRLNKRYELQRLIGSGGMANVFEAMDLVENKTVAVKLLKQEYLTHEEFVRRFRNESKVVSLLDHPNIVKIFDVNFTGADQYIVMECIDGITLSQYIRHQGKLRWKDAVFFVTQVLKALEHAHDHGIIHRDIKAQNIMLLRDGSIKVMDFGIARFARDDIRSMDDKAIGSVHYISPEQACGEESDARSDLYSVGVLFYEMLTGKVPFDGNTPEEVAVKHMKGGATPVAELNPEVPMGLCEIVEKAMQRDRNMRYHSAKEMLGAIDTFKQNPSIVFEYKYMMEETVPEEYNRSINTIRQTYDSDEIEEIVIIKRSPSVLILTGIAIACCITALMVILWFFYWNKTDKIPDVIMPNLVGQSYNEIKNDARYEEFNFVVEERAITDEYAAGVIYEQNVQSGLKVKANRTVKLKVSDGIATLYVPELTGMDVYLAQDTLYDLGLDYNIKTQLQSDVAADTVLKTDPPADTQVEKGTQVTLYVSREKVQASQKVPNVVGRDLETAIQMLEAVGLKVSYEEVESDKEPDVVLTQSIERNEYVVSGATIELTVSNGMGYYKQIPLTIELPKVKKSQEYKMVLYLDDEVYDTLTVDPHEERSVGIVMEGTEVSILKVAIDGEVYAEYELDFEELASSLIWRDPEVFGSNLKGDGDFAEENAEEPEGPGGGPGDFSFSDWMDRFS